jgi:tRNA A-37 threonylcarbamoyl transferase component Bud32
MLADEDDGLLAAARAIAAGQPVDWDAIESSGRISASFAVVLRELKVIAEIEEMHRSLPDPDSSLLRSADRDRSPSASAEAAAPDTASWGSLQLLERIGQGAFGDVYRAWDPRLDREVALKLLRRPESRRDSVGSHVIEEGRLLARVRHPNVVTVYGADRIGDRVGLWMEFVQGRTLEAVLQDQGPFDAQEATLIGLDLCRALSAVHNAGLIHRDVKAQNIVRDAGGRVVLMDFGAGRDDLADGPAELAGTPLYLAPEVLAGAAATVRSDIYSVGVLLFHLVTGSYPVKGRTVADIREAHDLRHRLRLRDVRPDLPDAFVTVVDGALESDPEKRHEAASAMEAALAQGMAPVDVVSSSSTRDRAASLQPVRRRSIGWAQLAAAVLAIAAVAAIALATTSVGRQLLKPMNGTPSAGSARTPFAGLVPTARRLELRGRWGPGGLSRNGRYFAMVAAGAPAVFDMTTGETRVLARPDGDGSAEFAIASPDGRSIAYQWWPGGQGPCELHVADRVSGADRTIFRDAGVDVPRLYDWSHDGTQILVKLALADGRRRVALIDVDTASARNVREFTEGDPDLMSLSMDGRYVAYDLPEDSPRPHRSIRIVDTLAGDEHALLADEPSNNRFPLWMSDGRTLFFLSDRSGTPDGWIVPVTDGHADGEPQVAARNLGPISPLGVTDNGALYYDFQAGQFDLYEAGLDPQAMTLFSQPHAIRGRRQGSNIGPSYSHDGRRLAYLSQRTVLDGVLAARAIVIRDLDSGDERELASPIEPGMFGPIWSPDDRRLLVCAINRTNQRGVFVVDSRTGAIDHQIMYPTQDQQCGRAIWASDGRAILLGDSGRGIVEYPLNGGHERIIFSNERIPPGTGLPSFAYSRDGSRLAFTAWNRSSTALDVVDPNGVVRELVTAERPRKLQFQAWFPGGDYLLYSIAGSSPREPDALWRVAASGGAPQPVGLSINAMTTVNMVALSPAGTAVAYTSGYVQYQLWVMENVLPR